MEKLVTILSEKTGISAAHVKNILKLIEEGSTIPFIARYRKEMTGGATDEQLREFDELYGYSRKLLDRKEEILRLIQERGTLDDNLRTMIEDADTLARLEDLYRPFKEKKSTRAGLAISRGLTPLADLMQNNNLSLSEFYKKAKEFVKGEVTTPEEAIQGARDIVAERFSDDPGERKYLRELTRRTGRIEVKAGKEPDTNGVYANYMSYDEKLSSIPSHRYLAIMRGVREKHLSLKLAVDSDQMEQKLKKSVITGKKGELSDLILDAIHDGLRRLALPSIEREIQGEVKERADRTAIGVFGKNLSQLLMTPPVGGRVILGVDPGFRTGCKLAVIDENGTFLDQGVIYPVPPKNDYETAKSQVLDLVKKYGITGVAIGNGTASRETQEFFARLNRETGAGLKYTVVSEAGASVYSASEVAQEEYPNLDVTIRGAVSIAQRLRDPMAALVKIDPVSLGIGQYQHDVDGKLLGRKLSETIEDLVNRVGVDVNSASPSLLSYVAGVGPKLARTIVQHRMDHGPFRTKKDIRKVKGMGAKAFEQCAGFLRIRDGEDLMDRTGIHPESYEVARKMKAKYPLEKLSQKEYSTICKDLSVGMETLQDIVKELQKPGFDPRTELPAIPFRDDVTDIEKLKEGSYVSGVVRNITDFGAFVDIGLKNDGLIHISEISERRIMHPMEILSVNQFLQELRVISVDVAKGRVSLSLRKQNS